MQHSRTLEHTHSKTAIISPQIFVVHQEQ